MRGALPLDDHLGHPGGEQLRLTQQTRCAQRPRMGLSGHSSNGHHYHKSSVDVFLNGKRGPRFAQEAALMYNISAISWA